MEKVDSSYGMMAQNEEKMTKTEQCYNGHHCQACGDGYYTYDFMERKFICVDCDHEFGTPT